MYKDNHFLKALHIIDYIHLLREFWKQFSECLFQNLLGFTSGKIEVFSFTICNIAHTNQQTLIALSYFKFKNKFTKNIQYFLHHPVYILGPNSAISGDASAASHYLFETRKRSILMPSRAFAHLIRFNLPDVLFATRWSDRILDILRI